MIKLEFPTHTVTVRKLEEADNLGVQIEVEGDRALCDIGPVYVNHALVDRIAELEAQLAAVGAGGITAGRPLMAQPDFVARGLAWQDAVALSKEACEQAGVKWSEKEPPAIAINVMHRLANNAHKAGFTAAMSQASAELAADGDLFRRMIEAMQTDGEAFAERMGALATDEPPTLAEFRQMLREALGDPVEPFDPDLMFAEFSVPAAARSDKLARYLWGLLELSARYGFDVAPGGSDWAEIYPNEKRGKHSEAYNDIVIRDWWCK